MTSPAHPIPVHEWRTFFAACAAHPLSAGSRMRNGKDIAWKLRGAACEFCGEALARETFELVPVIPAPLGGHAGFDNSMNCCPDCSAQCRLIDALPCVETAPENTRARLMERREAVLAGSLNEPVPGRLNRDGREAVLRERWQYPRSVAHVDAGRGMVGFQRVYAPDALVGVLGMVIRSATGVTGQIQERRWVGLSVDPGAFDGVARALVERNVLLRIVP